MRRDDMAYFEDAEFQQMLKHYEQSMEDGESMYMDAEELTDIAEYYMMQNEVEKANKCIDLAVQLHPDAVDPQVFMARQQLFFNNVHAAYEIFEHIIDREDGEVKFLHAELLLKEKQDEQAHNMMSEYFSMIDNEQDAFMYDTAEIFFDYESYDYALLWAKRLIKEYPSFSDADVLLCDIYMKLARYEDAKIEAENIVDKNPFNENGWIILAEALAMMEKCDESLEAVDYLLAINENHIDGMRLRASNLFYLNRIDESHKQYQKYLEQYPNDHSVLYLDGICLCNIGCNNEAEEALLNALANSDPDAPERVHIHLQLAYVQSKLHKIQEALKQLELCHNYPDPESPIDYNLARGHILLENEQYEEAEMCFDQALRESKKPYETLLLIGITLGETGHYQKATDIFLSLHNSTMENAEEKTSPYLAYCYLFTDNKEMYLQYLEEAVKLNPNTTQFLFSQFYPDIPVSEYYERATKTLQNNKLDEN